MAKTDEDFWLKLGFGAAVVAVGAFALKKALAARAEDEEDESRFFPTPAGPALVWPLPQVRKKEPTYLGSFGVKRSIVDGKQKMHAGVDIGAPYLSPVVAMEDGVVVNTVNGWAKGDTARILIEGKSGVINYAAISKKSWEPFGIKEGSHVRAGQTIARIGKYPGGSKMLHLELYRHGTRDNKKWYQGARPAELLNAEALLAQSVATSFA